MSRNSVGGKRGKESRPVKQRAGISLSRRRDVAVRSDIGKRKDGLQRTHQASERVVLRRLERAVVSALKFHAYRKIIASAAAAPGASAGVPRTAPDRHELDERAIAAHKKMRRNLQPPQSREIRIGRLIQRIREEPLYRVATEPPGRKTDRMHDQESCGHTRRALVAVGRSNVARSGDDTFGQDSHAASSGSRISSRCMR